VGGKGVVERVAGHLPEVGVGAHQAAQPGVLELLLPPQPRQRVGVAADPAATLATGAWTSNNVP
jgi:hypothetical protein